MQYSAMSIPSAPLFTAFIVTLLSVLALAPIAQRIGLVDEPHGRKQHANDVPLVGGLAIFISLTAGAFLWEPLFAENMRIRGVNAIWGSLGLCFLLLITGVLDDRFRAGVFARSASEVVVAILFIEIFELRLTDLGDLLGIGAILMPPAVSYCFSVLAIFGIINAFNMLDGIDGLLAMLVITTLLSFHIFTNTSPSTFNLYLMSSLAGFLVSNLALTNVIPKCFLGDAGSKLLGFIVVCLLLGAASEQVGGEKLIRPVTALYLVAIPLFDMVYTTSRRVARKLSAFRADRSHIHHLLLDLGYSQRRTLIMILSINLATVSLGLILHRLHAPDYYQMGIFVGCFILYSLITSQLWLVVMRVQSFDEKAEQRSNILSHSKGQASTVSSAKKSEVFPLRK